jgi:excinuclease ABC subunit A
VLAPLVAQRKGEYKDVFAEAKAEGFSRVRVDGEMLDLSHDIKLNKKVKHTIEVVVDRLVLPTKDEGRKTNVENTAQSSVVRPSSLQGKAQAGEQSEWDAFVTRLTDSIEQALRAGEGMIVISIQPSGVGSQVSGVGSTDAPHATPETQHPEEWLMSEENTCTHCGISFPELSPQMFSFNAPQGACPTCSGLGTRMELDPQLLVPNTALTLHEGAVPYWGELRKKKDSWAYRCLVSIGNQYEFNMDTPWEQMSDRARQVIIYGSGKERIRFSWNDSSGSRGEFMRPWEGLSKEIERRYQQTDSDWTREMYASFMSEQPCPTCRGARLKPESLAVTVGDLSIQSVCALNIAESQNWALALSGQTIDHQPPTTDHQSSYSGNGHSANGHESRTANSNGLVSTSNGHESPSSVVSHPSSVPLTPYQLEIAGEILKEIRERLGFLLNVGLHYLTLHRPAPTLSGGEAQRIRLASQIGSGLVGVMYILDEPSIGLHQRDNRKLLNTLLKLRDLGNTVIVVEHDLETMQEADYLVDFGPGAGVKGGEVVAEGRPDQVAANPGSLTGKYLSGQLEIAIPAQRRTASGPIEQPTLLPRKPKRGVQGKAKPAAAPIEWLEIEGATMNNLTDVSVRFPLGTFTCITGVSGSGKSSLITETLYPALANRLNKAQLKHGPYRALTGLEALDKVIDIDQQPIGRTPRSNPATYVKLFDLIRDMFAKTPEAKLRGYEQGRFSFNIKGGRCEACEGNGEKRIDMQFLADVWVRCDVCKGKRYNRETLQVKYKGKSIADVLEMDVQTALEFFDNVPRIRRILQTLHDVGLDYIALGQPATTLSGGEAQRVKLAKELARVATGRTVYILDEPTTGLHFADVQRLLQVLHRLVDAGNTVIVIEHSMDVIKTADWIIDMGPEGGDGGGYVVATGTPEDVALVEASHTGWFLREILMQKGQEVAA